MENDRIDEAIANRPIYIVYHMRLGEPGFHIGARFFRLINMPDHYYPHVIEMEGMTYCLQDENFRKDFAFIGEL